MQSFCHLPPPPTNIHTWKKHSMLFLPAYPPPPPNTHTQADTDMVFAFFANMLCCSMSPITPMVFTFLFYCSHQIIRMAHMMRFMQSAFCDSLYQIIRMLHVVFVFVFDQSIHIGSSECPTWSLGFFYRSLHIRLSECSR